MERTGFDVDEAEQCKQNIDREAGDERNQR